MKIAFLMTDGFEDSEFRVPYDRLKEAGMDITILGLDSGSNITGKRKRETVTVEESVYDIEPTGFEGVIIPGGNSPDKLRLSDAAVSFVKKMNQKNKMIAAICHGPQLMISADIVNGKKITSWPSIAVDLRNAGAIWEDSPVVQDSNFITSRKPDDLEKFCQAIISYLNQ